MNTTVKLLKKEKKRQTPKKPKDQTNGHANKTKAYFLNPPIK